MSLSQATRRTAGLMQSRSLRVVTAESCTAGLVAQSLSIVPGISEFLCGGLIVYRNATKQAFLNVPAELLDDPGPVSGEVCEAMLRGALDKTPEADVAVAVTGHLGPNAPEGLDGFVYVGAARRDDGAMHVCVLRLPEETREERQRLAAIEALELLSDMLALPTESEWPVECRLSRDEWSELVFGEVDAVCVGGADGDEEAANLRLVYPGSFNPLHAGHKQLANWAAQLTGGSVEFEISFDNVDKETLAFREAIDRLSQFDAGVAVWLTRAATFAEKASLFPGATFIVGADTIERLVDLSYYPGGADERKAALEILAAVGCRFLVFGRLRGEKYITLAELNLPAEAAQLCEAAPAEFRIDVASRDLKGQN